MQAGDEQTSHYGVIHTVRFVIWRSSEEPGGHTAGRCRVPRHAPVATPHSLMILPVHDRLRAHLARLLTTRYSLDPSAQPTLALEYPPNRDLGDLGTPVAFELARRLRKAPRAIAQEIASDFGTLEGVSQVAAAPNGYLNFFLERPTFLRERLTSAAPARPQDEGKAIVEHTAINPNKAAHIGHLRNAALGD